jgi:hypothetical protein
LSTDLTVAPELPARASTPALHNLRQAMMTLTTEDMGIALAEFTDRRDTFRRWLMLQLKEGVHYGFPPGCDPPKNSDDRRWKPKQSLYKAGADFLVELLGWRCTFTSDMDTWKQLGEPPTVCIMCHIVDGSGNPVGEGRGARSRGEKKMADNATIKMAEKCAKVNAVIHALSLSDLFTQDIEDLEPPKHEAPATDANAPRQPPRAVRITPDDLTDLIADWKKNNADMPKDEFARYVTTIVDRVFNVFQPHQWTLPEYNSVRDRLDSEAGREPPF